MVEEGLIIPRNVPFGSSAAFLARLNALVVLQSRLIMRSYVTLIRALNAIIAPHLIYQSLSSSKSG